jgi:hypothetical protein
MMLTTCNLLSRWCRRVEVVCPAAAADIPSYSGRGLLKDVVIQTMCDADPFGNFCISDSATLEQPISLHIGPVPPKTRPTVVIDSGGWTASLGSSNGRIPARFRDANIIGAVGAACLGVANVFKHAIGVSENSLIADGLFDLFRLERVPEDGIFDRGPRLSNLDLGNILVVGLGSVGSSFVHCLKLSRAICQAMLVDQDLIKVENFNRSPIFGRTNFALNKAEAVSLELDAKRTVARAFPGTWDEFIQAFGRPSDYDVWLPLANENGVRGSMQRNVPPMLVHAATNSNWGANHGRHIAGVDDCLMDRFPSNTGEAALTCSMGEVLARGERVDAALPFLSVFAGLLVFAELVRLHIPGYPQVPNYACVDFGGALSQIQKWPCEPRPECPCRNLSPSLYKLFNRTGRYFGLAFSEHRL